MTDRLKDYFIEHDRFASQLGFRLTELKEGQATVVAEAKEEHLNAAGVVHGGFLFALADVAFAAASNARNNLSLAIHADILYHQAGTPGTFIARAREIRDGTRIASYQVTIHTGDEELVASFTGTVYRKGKNILEEDEPPVSS